VTTILDLLWIMVLVAVTLSCATVLIMWAAGSVAIWIRDARQRRRQHAINQVRQLWRQ